MASFGASFQPQAISTSSRHGDCIAFPPLSRRRRAHMMPIVAGQLQQEKPLSNSRPHLERCLEAESTTQLASAASILSAQECKKAEELPRVVYQGHAGGYGHAVVDTVYGAGAAEIFPCKQMEGVFKAVETWIADAALVPIQNSLDGSIHRNYDLLLRHGLHIVGEVAWPVNHCLLAHPSASLSDLDHVLGHPQALVHCCESLANLGLRSEAVEDISDAALLVRTEPSWKNIALVASERAASVFGLRVLRSDIQDDSCNITRFLQLARVPAPAAATVPLLPWKTSIAFALTNGPKDLYKIMAAFALRYIQVTSLESRPLSQMQQGAKEMKPAAAHFGYVFFVDIEASIASRHTQKALRQVEELSSFYRVLGSYPLLQPDRP